jgi:pyruvate/2-oxoglutarate dehydrogenase complex dihydrolipoamide acyltransferase (E2) component
MEYRLPELGEGIYEADFVVWLVQKGQWVEAGAALAEVMTDKATMELPAPFTGRIESLLVEPGQLLEIGQVLLDYVPAGDADHTTRPDSESLDRKSLEESPAPQATRTSPTGDSSETKRAERDAGDRWTIPAAPAVRRLAQSLNVDLRDVPASGPGGRVLLDDLSAFLRTSQEPDAVAIRPSHRAAAATLGTPGQRVKLHGVRRAIAENMVNSKKTIPHYSYIDECDVTELVALRNERKRPLYAQRVKLTNLPFYVKAVVAALKRVPVINASLDEQSGEIVMHDAYHIGIATATSKGLVVPVIRHADRFDLVGIAREIERLIRGAQAGTLGRAELRGGTFTISSVGNFGGLVSTPIIHHPEVGIVAIGKVFVRPVFNEQGLVVPARIAYLSFSFDHRVVDGSVGAIFANAVIGQLEHPHALWDS